MSLFEKITWTANDKRTLHSKVRKCKGDWGTDKPEIVELRDRLLVLQCYRCAYCQYPITADMVGYRELDHILPKEGNAKHSDLKKDSENEKDRYATHGYPDFKFEPINIVLICKPCNSSKGTYDSLINRAVVRKQKTYPLANQFSCFHPHYHKYGAHIQINENFIYSYSTDEGRVLLKICGLMKVQNLEKKFAPAARKITLPGKDLYKVITNLAIQLEDRNFGLSHAVNALMANRKLTDVEAKDLIAKSLACITAQDVMELKNLCQILEARMIPVKKMSAHAVLNKALK